MKVALAAPAVLLVSAVMAAAETSEQSVVPASQSDPVVVVEPVGRAATPPVALTAAQLEPAEVSDVDVNRDGRISFDELLQFDLRSDF